LVLLVDLGLPKGRLLKPSEAPALWRELVVLGRELQCRPLDGVFLSIKFIAGVREVHRVVLAQAAWPRVYAVAGAVE
jgi:hypothetical protein